MIEKNLLSTRTNVSFKYYYYPFVITGILLCILLVAIYLFHNCDTNYIRPIAWATGCFFVFEFILMRLLSKDNKLDLFDTANGLLVEIEKSDGSKLSGLVKSIDYSWSYGVGDREDKIGDSEFDEGYISEPASGTRNSTSVQLPRVLLLNILTKSGAIFQLREELEYVQNVPNGWSYKLESEDGANHILTHKLKELKRIIQSKNILDS